MNPLFINFYRLNNTRWEITITAADMVVVDMVADMAAAEEVDADVAVTEVNICLISYFLLYLHSYRRG